MVYGNVLAPTDLIPTNDLLLALSPCGKPANGFAVELKSEVAKYAKMVKDTGAKAE